MKIAKYFFVITLIFEIVSSSSSFADRTTIAVLDFKTLNKPIVIEIRMGQDVFSIKWGDDQTNLFTSELITALGNAHKFDVLERDRMNDILKEHEFGTSGEVLHEKAIQLGKMIGAEYFVMGQVELIEAEQKDVKIPYSDHTRTELRGRMVVNMKIVDTRSGKIVAAKNVNSQDAQKVSARDHTTPSAFINTLKEKTVKLMVSGILDGVFPVKIIKIIGNQVFLNRGLGDIFKVGDIMDVYNIGEDLIDPDTQESLGTTEIEVGRIKITEIQPKFTKARMVEGKIEDISTGMICRLIQEPTEPKASEPKTPGSSSKPIPW